ncbi:MAG TPA: thioredoxin family protein [Pyrinomonadaceae bacterium]|nr:thioredoxin family protein [Pyrinomonadaceae bacterium]
MDENQFVRFKFSKIFLALLIASFAIPPAILAQRKTKHRTPAAYVPVTTYDPKRDAAKDIADAIVQAQRTKKNVLVEVGGDWCKWCHILDDFFTANEELLALREKSFVTVKVNFSDENQNEKVLSRYPPIGGYPHLFFLDSNGKLLLSQDTGLLENGRTYSLERLTTVLTNWGPKP